MRTVMAGGGLKRPQGQRYQLGQSVQDACDALNALKGEEAWWTPAVFTGDSRNRAAWESSAVIGVDCDWLDSNGTHAACDDAALRYILAHGAYRSCPATMIHRTPRGIRLITLLDSLCSDRNLYIDACKGANARTQAWIDLRGTAAATGKAGLSVDAKCTSDLARLYWAPKCTIPGKPDRSANVIILSHDVSDVYWLAQQAPAEEPIDLRREYSGQVIACSREQAKARARAYLAEVPGAVSGSGGHDATFWAVCQAVRLSVDTDDVIELVEEWNETCDPKWSSRELEHKIREAIKVAKLGDLLPKTWAIPFA